MAYIGKWSIVSHEAKIYIVYTSYFVLSDTIIISFYKERNWGSDKNTLYIQ